LEEIEVIATPLSTPLVMSVSTSAILMPACFMLCMGAMSAVTSVGAMSTAEGCAAVTDCT
jgi:hypothetical protein